MDIKRIIVGDLEENCYLLIKKNECVIVDPGDEFEKIKKEVGNLKVVGCLITHFHQDHIGALEEVISKYDVSVNKVDSKEFTYEIIETPGHTSESKVFYFPKEKIMLTGDFLFKESFGRTDLGGNNKDMIDSLNVIEKYSNDITIYPGHGEESNLGVEKQHFVYYKRWLEK